MLFSVPFSPPFPQINIPRGTTIQLKAFSLKSYKIDHTLHGGIASAAVYGALTGLSPQQASPLTP